MPRASLPYAPAPLTLLRLAVAMFAILAAGIVSHRISERAGLAALRTETNHRLDLFAAAVDGGVNRYAHVPAALARDRQVRALLHAPEDAALVRAAELQLGQLGRYLGGATLFVLDADGVVRAASNWDQADSFVGKDLSFRDYYRQAANSFTGRQFAISTSDGTPGYYIARPVIERERIIGVTVIRISLDGIAAVWPSLGARALIADTNGVVILSSVSDWRYTALEPLSPDALQRTYASRVYGGQRITQFPVALTPELGPAGTVVDLSRSPIPSRGRGRRAERYLVLGRTVPETGWWLMVFADLDPVASQAHRDAALGGIAVGFVTLLLAFLVQRRRSIVQQLESKALLEKANAELEIIVASRTSALIHSNVQLRREIQERRQAEKKLRAAQDELVQAGKLAVLGQLATGITHEINQPLGAIRTLAGNALEFIRRSKVETAANNLAIINRLVDQMGAIVAPLKNFARKSPARPGRVRLAEAVDNALFLLEQRLQKHDIRVDNACAGRSDLVWCDQNRLEQVLVNLIGNAADAMHGAPRRVLTLTPRPLAPGRLELAVCDSGPGLPPRVREHLFEPFFTTKPAGAGLGLGLAISRDIMHDLGGELVAGDAPEGGACFGLVLPTPPGSDEH